MRGCRFLAALTMVLLLVGCVRKPPAAAPLALTVEPAGGAPGSEVMLTVKASGEVQLPLSSPENGHWLAHLCWGECRPADWQIVSFAPVAGAPGQLTAKVRVPVHQAGRLFPNGALKLTVACQTKGCDGVPSASAEFQVASDVKQVAWATLPAAPAGPVPNLSGAAHEAVDPANPARRVVCETGSVSLNDSMGPPSLQVTADAGKTWRSISLQGVKLGQHGGMAGCRAVALDPHAPESFYLAGGGHMAAYDWDRDPAPLYTTDGGQSWTQVPAPAGADQPEAFIGYTMAPDGVTAWFARQEDQLIRGSHTADGGKTWQEVPLTCPASGPCAWEAPTSLMLKGYRGLLTSISRGRFWGWADWQGGKLEALGRGFHSLGGAVVEVAGATAPLLRSEDGGQTWIWVDLPEPPGGWTREPDLRLQPDGSLLLNGTQTYLLRRGATTWEPGT